MENSNIAFQIQVASKTIALDLLTQPHKFEDNTNKIVIKTINWPGWEIRLRNKCITYLTNDIYDSKRKNLNAQLTIKKDGLCGDFYNFFIFKCVDLNYNLK